MSEKYLQALPDPQNFLSVSSSFNNMKFAVNI